MRTAIVWTAVLWLGCTCSAGSQQGPTEVVLPEASAAATSSASTEPQERAPAELSASHRARAESTLNVLRAAVELWRATHDDVCPSVEDMVRDVLDSKPALFKDPWGAPYAIQCSDEAISVRSAGPDRKLGTADDIVSVSR